MADPAEAMAARRPYCAALCLEAGLEGIGQQRGSLYDADMADAARGCSGSGDPVWTERTPRP